MLTIDGAMGEGGGQILRTSLALALVTQREVRVENIRAGRAKPGMLRQHLACVRAAEAIGADVEGAAIGSTEVVVRPSTIRTGDHRFAVGSAGSACLVLQTVLPPLMLAGRASRVWIEGGTHNPFAPPFEFLERVFLPILNRMGPRITARLLRAGFHPAGGGEICIEIEPATCMKPLVLSRRGSIVRRSATALFANLPNSIALRELEIVKSRLGFDEPELEVREETSSPGPGNALIVELGFEESSEIVSGFGERGVRAEVVAERAVREVRRFMAADVPVGRRLADQLMIPFALAGGGRFRTLPLSEHSRTNVAVVGRFLDVAIGVSDEDGGRSVSVDFGDSGDPTTNDPESGRTS